MEKYFNPEETYDKAIKEKEIGVLRALLTGIIGSDPTFVTTEFDEAVDYIKNRSIFDWLPSYLECYNESIRRRWEDACK